MKCFAVQINEGCGNNGDAKKLRIKVSTKKKIFILVLSAFYETKNSVLNII